MFEENNNQSKPTNKPLIYAVAGVALLIVAISGSAYAYFTASQTSDTINGTTLDVKLDKPTVKLVSSTGTKGEGLIPIYDGSVTGHTTNQLTTAVNSTHKCVDANNYTVCKVYEITINNSGSSSTSINTSITLGGNATNVTWAKMTDATTFQALKDANNSFLDQNVTLAGSGSTKQYFVIYLKNTGGDQTTADAGKNITGTVTVTASTGSTIEATF